MESDSTSLPAIMEHLHLTSPPKVIAGLQTFTLFPTLPTELRLKIWAYACYFPRVLELQHSIIPAPHFLTYQRPPSVLHTTHESRTIGLAHYHLSFGTEKHPPIIYFNPVVDIIYFGSRQYDDEINAIMKYFRHNAASLDDRDQIQNIALAEYLWRDDEKGGPFAIKKGPWSIPNFHRSFPGLEKLIFVEGLEKVDAEKGDFEATWEIYTGVSLVESKIEQRVLDDDKLAVDAVISFFERRKLKLPDNLYPDVVGMRYGFS